MNSNNIELIKFIYNLYTQEINIWNENNKIKLFLPEGSILSEADKEFITRNKEALLDILQKNLITTNTKKAILSSNETITPLSFAQERLWFIDQYESGTALYNKPIIFKLMDTIDISLLEKSIFEIIRKHEVLRSVIKSDDLGQPYQEVQEINAGNLALKHVQGANIEELEKLWMKEAEYIFQLNSELPIKIAVYYDLATNNKYLNVLVHHIAFDGWSTDIFIDEVQKNYFAFKNNNLNNLNKASLQYRDYALWQRLYLNDTNLNKHIEYWKNQLANFERLNLVTDKPRPSKLDHVGENCYFTIPEQVAEKLRNLAKSCEVSVHNLLLAAYYLLLSIYSGQDDIVIGSPIANRGYVDLENLIGFFVNSLALRVRVDTSLAVKEFIKLVGKVVLEAQLHQDVPFERLVEILHIARDQSRHPLFSVMFGVQNFGNNSTNNQEAILSPYTGQVDHKVATFDISTFIEDTGSGDLTGLFNYASSLYTKTSIQQFIKTYQHILQQFAKIADNSLAADLKISELNYLDEESYQTIIYDWNKTQKNYAKEKFLHQLFEEQVEKTPHELALVYEDKSLTYQELNQAANRLAHLLINDYQVKSNQLVAFYLDRSELTVLAILAILKAGAAYVPLDPSYPAERIAFILQDTKAQLCLTKEKYVKQFKLMNCKTQPIFLALDSVEAIEKTQVQNDENPQRNMNSNHLAYVIYTSGTTKQPKGVMVAHKGIVNTLLGQLAYAQLDASATFGLLTPFIFDASVPGMFLSLISGGKLVIANEVININLNEFIKKNNISAIVVSSTILALLDLNEELESLKTLIIGGEKPDERVLSALVKRGINIYQEYGLTETSVTCSYAKIEDTSKARNIGKPLQNMQCYVLNKNLQPLPVGAVGELVVGGVGLAQAYLNQPELNKEKFINEPYLNSSRLFKTGDLVRWKNDGTLEYIGRNDFQVKIRGHRIELGEIESVLKNYKNISHVVAMMISDENNIQHLVAYYTSDDKLDDQYLKEYLQAYLPSYMVPNYYVHLSQLPLTLNGKVDRKSLPMPQFLSKQEYIAPRNEIESTLVNTWSQVLEIPKEKISVEDDFFLLGGNSIKVIQLQTHLAKNKALPFISVVDIFKYPSIRSLVNSLSNKKTIKYNQTETLENTDIAIIAMSGAFSGCENLEEFWALIRKGEAGLEKLDNETLKSRGVLNDKINHAHYVPVSGYIKNMEQFDSEFWGMSPLEAKLSDPQIRKFLEHAWIALEKSGYIAQREELNIGVFAGCGYSDYLYNNILQSEFANNIDMWQVLQSNNKDFLATRVSYMLGLTGPSLNINTACSTSLVAVIEACEKLALGRCDIALAGGVSLAMPELHGYLYEEGMILSKDGVCRPFDSEANGTVGGSGVGVVILKRLSDAKRDKDNILSVIKGYAINNDGKRKSSFSAPSIVAQAECIYSAQKMAGIQGKDIAYIECHGTGTKLGDPIELEALYDAFTADENANPKGIFIGSVKANIGHADSAAGIAGLFKVCKMLQEKIIPPQINFQTLNSSVPHQDLFKVATVEKEWNDQLGPGIAGVSSFGIGGTNAHLIMAEYKEDTANEETENLDKNSVIYLLPFSAKSKAALQKYLVQFTSYLEKNPNLKLANIASTLQNKREHFTYRTFVTACTIEEVVNKIKQKKYTINKVNYVASKLAFAFPGQGSQFANMGLALYQNDIFFKKEVDQCLEILNSLIDFDFRKILFPSLFQDIEEEMFVAINQTQWAQLAIYIISYAAARFLERLGLDSAVYIGHSIGEYVAATLSGVFSLKEALQIVLERGRLMQSMPSGGMLAVESSIENIKPYLNDYLELAVVNDDNLLVISGEINELENLQVRLNKLNIQTRKLKTSHAFHSFQMNEAAIAFEKFLTQFKFNTPKKHFISNVTGNYITNEDAINPAYWAKQLRSTVQFSAGLKKIKETIAEVLFVEVGAGNVLNKLIIRHKDNKDRPYPVARFMHTLEERKHQNTVSIEEIIGTLWGNGATLNFSTYFSLKSQKTVELPAYQFNSQKIWINPSVKNRKEQVTIKAEDKENKNEEDECGKLIEDEVTEFDRILAKFFSQLLGVNELSLYESFFDLGGDSIKATQLISKVNQTYACSLSVSDIYLYPSIAELRNKVMHNKNFYQPILKLSNINSSHKNLFMIHPGAGGCEVYINLAKKLSADFNCYGVDSYNLYNENKITSLQELAEYYLDHILLVMNNKLESEYHLLGWSFGGHLALEIAGLLEKKGASNINVYLLDTIIFSDEISKKLITQVDIPNLVSQYRKKAKNEGYDQSYIDKVAKNLYVESQLVTQDVSFVLQKTKVILFKAMQEDDRFTDVNGFTKASQHITKLPYSNVNRYVPEKAIQLVEMMNASHGTVLAHADFILKQINFLSLAGYYQFEKENSHQLEEMR